MIKFKDTCSVIAKEIVVTVHEDIEYSVSKVGLPNGLESVLSISRAGKSAQTLILPNEVFEAIHEITS